MTRTLGATVAVLVMAAGPAAAQQAYAIRVAGLSCPFCSYGIEKQLRGLDGVTDVTTRIERGVVRVETAAGSAVTEAQLRRAVRQAGFTPKGVKEAGDGG